jgi:hypothetical protein
MKSDMLRQILALSKISQKHNEIQLAITDKLKESLDKNIAAAASPECQIRRCGHLWRLSYCVRSGIWEKPP